MGIQNHHINDLKGPAALTIIAEDLDRTVIVMDDEGILFTDTALFCMRIKFNLACENSVILVPDA